MLRVGHLLLWPGRLLLAVTPPAAGLGETPRGAPFSSESCLLAAVFPDRAALACISPLKEFIHFFMSTFITYFFFVHFFIYLCMGFLEYAFIVFLIH